MSEESASLIIAIMGVIATVVVMFTIVGGIIQTNENLNTKPCNYFKGYSLNQVPIRCVKYFENK